VTGPSPDSARHSHTLLLPSTSGLPTLAELQSRPFKDGLVIAMIQLAVGAFKEKEVKKEEEEKGLQVHFDSSSCVDTRIDRVCLLSRFSQQQTFAFVHTLSSL